MKVTKGKLPGDCGICAVATILHISWREAARLVYPNGIEPKIISEGTDVRQVVAALNQHTKNAVDIPRIRDLPGIGDRWQYLPNQLLLLYVRFGLKLNSHHWVVFDGKYIYDSNFNQKLTVLQYKDVCLDAYGFHVRVEAYLPINI